MSESFTADDEGQDQHAGRALDRRRRRHGAQRLEDGVEVPCPDRGLGQILRPEPDPRGSWTGPSDSKTSLKAGAGGASLDCTSTLTAPCFRPMGSKKRRVLRPRAELERAAEFLGASAGAEALRLAVVVQDAEDDAMRPAELVEGGEERARPPRSCSGPGSVSFRSTSP